jgi:hypothetical protein
MVISGIDIRQVHGHSPYCPPTHPAWSSMGPLIALSAAEGTVRVTVDTPSTNLQAQEQHTHRQDQPCKRARQEPALASCCRIDELFMPCSRHSEYSCHGAMHYLCSTMRGPDTSQETVLVLQVILCVWGTLSGTLRRCLGCDTRTALTSGDVSHAPLLGPDN